MKEPCKLCGSKATKKDCTGKKPIYLCTKCSKIISGYKPN